MNCWTVGAGHCLLDVSAAEVEPVQPEGAEEEGEQHGGQQGLAAYLHLLLILHYY